MKFDLKGTFTLSDDISKISKEIEKFIATTNETILKKGPEKLATIEHFKVDGKKLILTIASEGAFRPHNALLQIKNALSKELGKNTILVCEKLQSKNTQSPLILRKNRLKM